MKSTAPLFWAPSGQQQSLSIVFLLVKDGGTVKVDLVVKVSRIRALRGLKPFHKLLLGAFLAEVVKGRALLLIVLFIFKDWGLLLASETDAIPEVFIFGISVEAPYEDPSWYSLHEELLFRSFGLILFQLHARNKREANGSALLPSNDTHPASV